MFSHLTHTPLFRSIAVVVIVAFVTMIPAQSGYAQMVTQIPAPGQMVHPSGAFDPALMLGLKVDFKDPFNFYFVMDKGQEVMANDAKKAEYQKLIRYFLAALTTPTKDMWVNLSPVESNRIIPDALATTGIGADMLAQDYLLKQFTASLMYPEDEVGKEFWRKIYSQAYEKFGSTEIPVDTFNKVWITADKADIYQKNDTAFLVNSHLKVMLEQDFMAIDKNMEQFGAVEGDVPEMDASRKLASDLVREVIIPIIEKEVNEGGNFAQVRQIYSSMILATWFKRTLKQSLLGQVYADQNKVAGIQGEDQQAKEKIYQQYLEAYKVGVFNYIKEEADPVTQELTPRKYFSGGLTVNPENIKDINASEAMRQVSSKPGWVSKLKNNIAIITTSLVVAGTAIFFSANSASAQSQAAADSLFLGGNAPSMMAATSQDQAKADTTIDLKMAQVRQVMEANGVTVAANIKAVRDVNAANGIDVPKVINTLEKNVKEIQGQLTQLEREYQTYVNTSDSLIKVNQDVTGGQIKDIEKAVADTLNQLNVMKNKYEMANQQAGQFGNLPETQKANQRKIDEVNVQIANLMTSGQAQIAEKQAALKAASDTIVAHMTEENEAFNQKQTDFKNKINSTTSVIADLKNSQLGKQEQKPLSVEQQGIKRMGEEILSINAEIRDLEAKNIKPKKSFWESKKKFNNRQAEHQQVLENIHQRVISIDSLFTKIDVNKVNGDSIQNLIQHDQIADTIATLKTSIPEALQRIQAADPNSENYSDSLFTAKEAASKLESQINQFLAPKLLEATAVLDTTAPNAKPIIEPLNTKGDWVQYEMNAQGESKPIAASANGYKVKLSLLRQERSAAADSVTKAKIEQQIQDIKNVRKAAADKKKTERQIERRSKNAQQVTEKADNVTGLENQLADLQQQAAVAPADTTAALEVQIADTTKKIEVAHKALQTAVTDTTNNKKLGAPSILPVVETVVRDTITAIQNLANAASGSTEAQKDTLVRRVVAAQNILTTVAPKNADTIQNLIVKTAKIVDTLQKSRIAQTATIKPYVPEKLVPIKNEVVEKKDPVTGGSVIAITRTEKPASEVAATDTTTKADTTVAAAVDTTSQKIDQQAQLDVKNEADAKGFPLGALALGAGLLGGAFIVGRYLINKKSQEKPAVEGKPAEQAAGQERTITTETGKTETGSATIADVKTETEVVIAAKKTEKPVVAVESKNERAKRIRQEQGIVSSSVPALLAMLATPGIITRIKEQKAYDPINPVKVDIDAWFKNTENVALFPGTTQRERDAMRNALTEISNSESDRRGMIERYKEFLWSQVDRVGDQIKGIRQTINTDGMDPVEKVALNNQIPALEKQRVALEKEAVKVGKVLLVWDAGDKALERQVVAEPAKPVSPEDIDDANRVRITVLMASLKDLQNEGSVPYQKNKEAIDAFLAPNNTAWLVGEPADVVGQLQDLWTTINATPDAEEVAAPTVQEQPAAVPEVPEVPEVAVEEPVVAVVDQEQRLVDLEKVLTSINERKDQFEPNKEEISKIMARIAALDGISEKLQSQETDPDQIEGLTTEWLSEMQEVESLATNLAVKISTAPVIEPAVEQPVMEQPVIEQQPVVAENQPDQLTDDQFVQQTNELADLMQEIQAELPGALESGEVKGTSPVERVEFALDALTGDDLAKVLKKEPVDVPAYEDDYMPHVQYLMDTADPQTAIQDMLKTFEQSINDLESNNTEKLAPEQLKDAVAEDRDRLAYLKDKFAEALQKANPVVQGQDKPMVLGESVLGETVLGTNAEPVLKSYEVTTMLNVFEVVTQDADLEQLINGQGLAEGAYPGFDQGIANFANRMRNADAETKSQIFSELSQAAKTEDMKAKIDKYRSVGGINLSDEHLTINIKVDGQGMPLPAKFQDPAMSNIQGLSPIIREIAPMTPLNMPVISELLEQGAPSA